MKLPLRNLILMVLMVAASGMAVALKPTKKIADFEPREKLEALVPSEFDGWRSVPSTGVVLADPQTLETLSRLYSETLSRTYIDSQGRQIMLSIAYGADQRDGMGLHYPEVCYPAQGFQTRSKQTGEVSTSLGSIRVKRLEMVLGQRHEPVTYWTMIGDHQFVGGVDKKLNEIRYSLRGTIPDGLLFRVSSVSQSSETAYRDHEEFIGALLAATDPSSRKRLAGL